MRVDDELGVGEVAISCAIPGQSRAAKRVCDGRSIWTLRSDCPKHTNPWVTCCQSCRTLLTGSQLACNKCNVMYPIKWDLL